MKKICAIISCAITTSLLIVFYFELPFLQIYIFWFAICLFSWIFFFFSFYPDLNNAFFKWRTKHGEKKTEKNSLDSLFKNQGGLIGYVPICCDHIALIYISESNRDFSSLKNNGILLLMEYYRQQQNKDHYMYFCSQSYDFSKIVKSNYVTGIHVFGHGRISTIFFEDGAVQYREFKGVSPKEFIAQWHCNHGDGTSLGEYIGKKYFVPKGKRRPYHNKKDIEKLIHDELEWEINELFP